MIPFRSSSTRERALWRNKVRKNAPDFYEDTLGDLLICMGRAPVVEKVKSTGNLSVLLVARFGIVVVSDAFPLPVGMMKINFRRLGKWMVAQQDYTVAHPSFVGKGIGRLMYRIAAEKFDHFASDESLSPGARKAWYDLSLEFPVRVLHTKEKVLLPIDSWTEDKGAMMPMVKAPNGKVYSVDYLDSPSGGHEAVLVVDKS